MDAGSRGHEGASSVLYRNTSGTVVLLDIPRSLEESQSQKPFTGVPRRRIYSAQPVSEPFQTPEPRHGGSAHLSQSPAAQVADLMTAATVESALETLHDEYHGSYCLPRLLHPAVHAEPTQPFVPPGARYCQGDIQTTRDEFMEKAPMFDLIVLDPPWPNRSARRTNKYVTAANQLETRQLLSLIPIASRLAPEGLVAVWVTNSSSVLDLLTSRSGLFASWGLELAAEWTWVKITSAGEPIYDVNSQWRKPWEKLLIAKRAGSKKTPVLQSKVVFAVPDLHSRKPNLRGLFQEILGQDYDALEVFARNLTASWWAWGNEVLCFQEMQHWEVSKEDET